MISTSHELQRFIARTLTEFSHRKYTLSRVAILFKNDEVISNASEYDVRALCVLVHRGYVSIDDVQVIEYYYDDDQEMQENIMIFRNDGNFENDFKSAFFDLCSMLALETF